MSRGQRPDGGDGPGAPGWGGRVQLNGRGAHHDPGAGIGEAHVKPRGLTGARIAIGNVETGRCWAAASADPRPDLDAALAERAPQLNALRIRLLNDNGVAAELGGEPISGTADDQQHARRHDGTTHDVPTCRRVSCHWTIPRAPTHRATHQAPWESCASSRDNLTPVFEL